MHQAPIPKRGDAVEGALIVLAALLTLGQAAAYAVMVAGLFG